MTTELEQEFFRVFGIENGIEGEILEQEFFRVFGIENGIEGKMAGIMNCAPEHLKCVHCNYYKHIDEYTGRCTKFDYPDITAEKLLEMICICNSTYINGYTNYFVSTGKTKEELKEEILKKCITLSKDINNQIQQLFKGDKQ